MEAMKTTVEIPDGLFAEAKEAAHRRGVTLRQLIEDGLRASIRQHAGRRVRFRLKDGSFGGAKSAKELSWPEIRSVIYEGRGE
jgi:hypothetical protein